MLDLIERLEKAEGGNRGLDALVFCGAHHQYRYVPATAYSGACVATDDGFRTAMFDLPAYTTSLDAIVALIGEKVPGWDVVIRIPSKPTFKHVCELGAPDNPAASITDPWPFRTSAGASSAPLAACIALLRALHTQEQRHG